MESHGVGNLTYDAGVIDIMSKAGVTTCLSVCVVAGGLIIILSE